MAKDKGKKPMIDERSKTVFKKGTKGGGGSRGKNKGIVIEEPRVGPRTPIPIAFSQRFVSPEAKQAYTKRFISRKLLIEKPLIEEEVNPEFLKDLDEMGFGALKVIPDFPLNDTVVREFYANLDRADLEEGFVRVRKVKVSFTPEIINAKYKLQNLGEEDKDYTDVLRALVEAGRDPLEELRVSIHVPTPWTLKSGNERKEISTADWPEDWRVKCRFIQSRLLPKYNIGHFGIDDLGMLYAVANKLAINVGKVLYDEIVGHLTLTTRCILVPYLIHSLCRDAKVPEYASDHTTKKPKGIKRQPKRVEYLAEKGIEDKGRGARKPKRMPTCTFTHSERLQLSVAEALAFWQAAGHANLQVVMRNLERIANELKIKDLEQLSAPLFRYHDEVEKAILDAKFDEEESAAAPESSDESSEGSEGESGDEGPSAG